MVELPNNDLYVDLIQSDQSELFSTFQRRLISPQI